MFSGIVEAQSRVITKDNSEDASLTSVRIFVQRPPSFDDIKSGDSIAVNGVCLTLENFDTEKMQFCLGPETVAILSGSLNQWNKYQLNLERSMKLGDRVHGHLVTGHVDGVGQIIKSYKDGDSWQLQIQVPAFILKFIWKKGSVSLNGVSLTVNEVDNDVVSVCLIPETIARTNLTSVVVGEFVNIEVDYLAKAFFHSKVEL